MSLGRAPSVVSPAEYHALGVITAAELAMLELRFDKGMSVRRAAAVLGLSRSAARERVANGLRKIAAFEETKAA